MAEKSTNKVVFGDKTLIDLTNDTVTPQTLMEGVTAHDASGQLIRGEASVDNAYFDDNITVLSPNSSFVGTTAIIEDIT